MRTVLAFTLLAAAAASPAVLLAQGAAQAGPIELNGQCEYSDRFAELAGGVNGLAQCDMVVIARGGAAYDFRRERVGSMVRYEGKPSGDTMTITRVQVRNRPAEAAEGSCEIFRRQDGIRTVTCVAMVGQVTYAANFIRRNW